MARTADKPGTYRVYERNGGFVLSGVRTNGERAKLRDLPSRAEAERLAKDLFGLSNTVASGIGPIPSMPQSPTPVDDWGLPIRVSAETVASVQQSFGLGGTNTPPVTGPNPVSAKETEEKKIRRAKQAKSLMELAGISFAAGDVWLARRVTTNLGREPVNPNPKQVNDLADATKETLVDWFGDREVKPWQMMFLLAIGIPISMLIQSPKAKQIEPESKLKSVP